MPKAIVLFSDGTGNSAAALFKTNVWRLYQALDLSPPEPGEARQIAYYDDGVGTSTFKLLAVLGGIFGLGLKRNVLDIYTFLCRNYEPGDRIYAFGFSRGAFTVRVLVGLVVKEGLIQCEQDAAFRRHAADAYREYRKRYNQTGGLVGPLRFVRDLAVRTWRKWRGQTPYEAVPRLQIDEIAFVGVWDTVAAYGLPLAELTRAIDDWVWPLSMPNYKLSEKVQHARHALALDDERDTFHPLLWDEVAEAEMIDFGRVRRDRLRQVWFAGVHSNLGGGYPDDSLSYVSLAWMLGEATKAGLRFDEKAVAEIGRIANPYGPIYNSRRGLAAYYRYQPRKISARLNPPDPTTRIMQDTDLKGAGLLTGVRIHESVLERIRQGDDDYAPIVLPAAYEIVRSDETVEPSGEAHPNLRAQQQEEVWNIVWKRRVTYFSTVVISLLIAAMPLLEGIWPPSACTGVFCVASPVLSKIGEYLPGFLSPWLDAFANRPGWFLIGVIAIAMLLRKSTSLQVAIHDRMRDLWAGSLGMSGPSHSPKPPTEGVPASWIYRLRTNAAYQGILQFLKWQAVPNVFGIAILAAGIVGGFALALMLTMSVVYRTQLQIAEYSNRFCVGPTIATEQFSPHLLCWSTGQTVEPGTRYKILLRVIEPWFDEDIATSPAGFGAGRMPWYLHYTGIPARRFPASDWLQTMAKIVPANGRGGPIEALDMVCDPQGTWCSAELVAKAEGVLHLFANDAVVRWDGLTDAYYGNNSGLADVTVEPMELRRN
ncbi:DUF2235 domain-containing protein [Microvirga zambiensis]|uniref:DUF2235 domain-containing protein n=1 Tax=Microvirga zambiensis TaxID=1402137 RepID=UPI00191E760B|nr:DUF2235 domain-containing protein [Microvirga zambiensis]